MGYKSASAAAAAETAAIGAAIGPLAGYARDVPLRVQMAAGWKPADTASAALWVVGEIGGVADLGPQWGEGFDATATLTTPADVTVATGRVSSPRGARAFRIALTPSQPLTAGDYILRVEGNDSTGVGGGGFQCCWTNAHVAVTVKAAGTGE